MKKLSLATVFAAVSGFVVLWVAQWALDADTDYRYFAAFWGLFFASAGLIDGITHETTRAVAASRESGRAGDASPWRFAAALAAGIFLAFLAGGAVFMPGVVPSAPAPATALLIFGLASYVFQAALSGVLSGARLWDRYAGLVALDSGVRLVLALVAWWAGWGLPAFLVITVVGAVSWVLFLRRDLRAAVDVDKRAFARRVGSAMLASGASAALITGFPTAANAAFPLSEGAAVSAIINAVILTRAPVLVPLQRFQSALVVRFVEQRDRVYAALAGPIAAVLGVGAVGFAAAWLIGPWILRAAFKPEMFVPGVVLGALTFASAFMGALMVTGVAVLAQEKHGWYVAGWIVASVVAFALMFALPFGVVATVVIALFAGPLAGSAVHAVGLSRTAARAV
ncbi:hypothetical protein [Corynebacterium senegalense]|uniref:hypothetical protein n=1 Tax=Corynebacterium senegalense TaxID=2080750 RepID=UPI000E2036AC|nr:hypothetical protein [Corynebacterium senegalense]